MAHEESKDRLFGAGLLIASDRSYEGVRPDETGPVLKDYLGKAGYDVLFSEIVPDDKQAIKSVLQNWVADGRVNLIIVSGGTGLGPRDVTPEATLEVIERRVPGMEEAMRRASFEKTAHAILSRAVVGTAGKSLIVNLPGNPLGAVENLEVILPALDHALELICGGTPDP